jgi:tetratricopeptide (TPR) repeat protein
MKQSRDKNTFHHLHEAYRSFQKKNYTNTIIILEQTKDSGHEDHYALFLQAVSLLYSNNFQAANNMMEKIQRISPAYTPFIQLKSFLALKSSVSREAALASYISALEKNSSDKLLRKGLRAVEEASDFYKYQREAKISDLVFIPKPGKRDLPAESDRSARRIHVSRGRNSRIPEIKPLYIAVLFLVVISAAALTIFYIYKDKLNFDDRDAVKLSSDSLNKIDMIDISGSGYGIINRINQEKTLEFYSSGDTLLSDFNEARMLVKKGFFNKSIIILNRIANSNASFPVKEKSDFLIRFIMESDERVYEEIDLKQINEKPYLYRGSAVKYTGKAANVKETKSGTAFNIMIGYDGNNFKGICEVYDSSKGVVENGDIVEVQGLFILNIGKSGAPYITAEKVSVVTKNNG